MPLELRRSARHRIQAAAEALLPGLPSENLGLLAKDVARVAQAVLARGETAPTLEETDEVGRAVDASAARFLSHLSRRSTAELWESFAVPWDYAGLLARVRSGRYAEALAADAAWALERTVAMFGSASVGSAGPRSVGEARKAASAQVSGREPVRLSGR